MENQFEVKQDGAVLSIVLGNELSTVNAPLLMDELNKYRDKGIEKVVFDASNLTYIASSGVRVIVFAKQKLGGDPDIVFVNCQKDIYDIFELIGVQDYIEFVEK